MIANIETALASKVKFSAFANHKLPSSDSMPVSEVEAWLDERPHKRDHGNRVYPMRRGEFNVEISPNQKRSRTLNSIIGQDVASKKPKPKTVGKPTTESLKKRVNQQNEVRERRIEKLERLLAAGGFVTPNDIGVAESTLGNYLCFLRGLGWVIKKTSKGYKMIEQGK